ncbi:LOW QUALITY PROTEIN: uncharacterized protein [Notamacropus eugenii]|uniref:LOW QUALITY PROTEIN: uncharacterized protein n=1 Tax=Notamacropus eugenii TaxID=9315 RepID=UPI003B680F44
MGAVTEEKKPPLVSQEQIKKAVEALLAYMKNKQNANTLLLNENENMFLMVTLWKIPPNGKEIRIPLPHAIRPDTKEVCLFTKDESNLTSEQTENFYKQLLKKNGITSITEVIPYKKLKHEYKPYEAKRRLLSSFDLFLADERIRRLLPSHIGKHFYRRKKVPVSVDLTTKNLSKHINRIVQGTSLTVTNHGCCNTARVGHTGMLVDHLVENIVAAVGVLSEKLPEKWESVKILHLKTEKSLSLPVFSSFVSHLGTQRSKKQKQNKKVARKPAPTAVKPESECALDGHDLEAEKMDRAEPDSDDEIPQLVPVQTTSPQKRPKLQKAGLTKEPAEESLSAETPQAKAPGKKRKASMALGTPKETTPQAKTPGEKRKSSLALMTPKEITPQAKTPGEKKKAFMALATPKETTPQAKTPGEKRKVSMALEIPKEITSQAKTPGEKKNASMALEIPKEITPQAKTPGKKRRASMALATPKEITSQAKTPGEKRNASMALEIPKEITPQAKTPGKKRRASMALATPKEITPQTKTPGEKRNASMALEIPKEITPQAKTPGKKRRASMALEIPKEITSQAKTPGEKRNASMALEIPKEITPQAKTPGKKRRASMALATPKEITPQTKTPGEKRNASMALEIPKEITPQAKTPGGKRKASMALETPKEITPQAKTPGGKRKASKALGTPEQIIKASAELKKTPVTGTSKTKDPNPKKPEKKSNSSVDVKALENRYPRS